MHDKNDNDVDDNLEYLAILGGLTHFGNQQKSREQSTKQLEETRRLREATERAASLAARSAESAVRAQQSERDRINSLPQCPVCGGRLEGQFRKCKHCTSDLSWVEGHPCEPGKEHEVQENLDRQRKLRESKRQETLQRRKSCERESLKLKAELNRLTKDLLNECPRCCQPRPGTYVPWKVREFATAEAQDWVKTMPEYGCCPECRSKEELQKTIRQIEVRQFRRQFLRNCLYTAAFWLFCAVAFYVAYVSASNAK